MQCHLSNERIPDIFIQKHNYQKHLNKLGELHHSRSHNTSINRQEIIDQYRARKQQSFIRRALNNEEKIKKQNSFILDRLSKSKKPSLGKLSNSQEGRLSHQSIRKRFQEKTNVDNLQLYYKLNKLTPSIDNKKFQIDYDNSVKIRNRISRFQRNPNNNTSVSKLNRYFQLSARSSPVNRKEQNSLNFTATQKVLPKPKKMLPVATKFTSFSSKLQVMYQKQDILKNKIGDKWSILKRKKFHSTMNQVKDNPKNEIQSRSKLPKQIISETKDTNNKMSYKNAYQKINKRDRVFPTQA